MKPLLLAGISIPLYAVEADMKDYAIHVDDRFVDGR